MNSIPTITQLYNDILADLRGQFGTTIIPGGKYFLSAMAAVQSAKLKLYYLAIGNLQKNIFIDTADSVSNGGTLERFGFVKLGRYPYPATAGQYSIQVTGTVGAVIPASATFKSNDDALNPGILYVLDVAHTLTATTDYITIRALTAGLDSKLNVSDGITATAPIANVTSAAIVFSEVVPPLAAEDIESYRALALNTYRLEPEGGAATDYVLWATGAQGVQKAYPYIKSGANNEINLFIEAVLIDSTDGKGTPGSTILNAVDSAIELNPDTTLPISERGRRPLGVFQVNMLPVNIRNVDIQITGFSGITSDIQTKIFNSLKDAIYNIRPFVSGADIVENKNDIIDVNKIAFIILTARPGSLFTGVTLKIDSVSYSSFQFINGDIPFLNPVTYV